MEPFRPDDADPLARLGALSPLQIDELCHVIGEAALDLWLRGESWPDLVERCLEAIEEDEPAHGWVSVPVVEP